MAEKSRSPCLPLVRGILLYVVANPDAKDTLDGIQEFWLSRSPVRHGKNEVREALDYLTEKKRWLSKNKAGAAVTLYGLNKPHLPEIKKFLQKDH